MVKKIVVTHIEERMTPIKKAPSRLSKSENILDVQQDDTCLALASLRRYRWSL